MIYAYTGKTGSGKTFSMVKDAYEMWKAGADIYSNTILKFEQADEKRIYTRLYRLFRKRAPKRGRIIYFEDISEILEAKRGVILFDEAQVLFNARQWESLPEEFQYKLQQHRKHRLDLLCTTQNMGTIDISYRRLVQVWHHHYKVAQLGQERSLLGLFRREQKDIDELYNTVDDLKVETLATNYFLIHALKRRLYDTFFDIGFKRFKTIWQITKNSSGFDHKAYIIPKTLKFENALRSISLLQSGSNRSKWKPSKTT